MACLYLSAVNLPWPTGDTHKHTHSNTHTCATHTHTRAYSLAKKILEVKWASHGQCCHLCLETSHENMLTVNTKMKQTVVSQHHASCLPNNSQIFQMAFTVISSYSTAVGDWPVMVWIWAICSPLEPDYSGSLLLAGGIQTHRVFRWMQTWINVHSLGEQLPYKKVLKSKKHHIDPNFTLLGYNDGPFSSLQELSHPWRSTE